MARKISASLIDLETKAVLTALANDVAALRTALIGALAKLDDDAGVTDTTYESLWTPAALTATA